MLLMVLLQQQQTSGGFLISGDFLWKLVGTIAAMMAASLYAAIKLSRRLNFKSDWLAEWNAPDMTANINKSRVDWLRSSDAQPILRSVIDSIYEKRVVTVDDAIKFAAEQSRMAGAKAAEATILASANQQSIRSITDSMATVTEAVHEFPKVISELLGGLLEPIIQKQTDATIQLTDAIRTLDHRQREDGHSIAGLEAIVNTPTYHGRNRRHGERADDEHEEDVVQRRRRGEQS